MQPMQQYAVVSAHGKQAIKLSATALQQLIARKQAVDSAVQRVVTEVPTTLPTVQIKVSSPFTLTSASHTRPRPCTAATMALKHPIPAVSAINAAKRYSTSMSASVAGACQALPSVVTTVAEATRRMQALPAVSTAPTALVSVKTSPVIHSTEASRVLQGQIKSDDIISSIGTVSLSTKPQTVQVIATPRTASLTSPVKSLNRSQAATVSPTRRNESAASPLAPKTFDLSKLRQQGLVLMRTASGQLQLVRSAQPQPIHAAQHPCAPDQVHLRAGNQVRSNRAHTSNLRVSSPIQRAETSSLRKVTPSQQGVTPSQRAASGAVNQAAQPQQRHVLPTVRPVHHSTLRTPHNGDMRQTNQQVTTASLAQAVGSPVRQLSTTAQHASTLQPRLVTSIGNFGSVQVSHASGVTLPGAVVSQASLPRLVLVNMNGQLMAQAVQPSASVQLVQQAVQPSASVQLVQQAVQPSASVHLVQQPALQLATPLARCAGGQVQLVQQPVLRPIVYQPGAVQSPVAMIQDGICGPQMTLLPTGLVQPAVNTSSAVVNLNQVFQAKQ